ncbi:MAG: hypothetical protein WAO78_13650 [Roseovarius sp.]
MILTFAQAARAFVLSLRVPGCRCAFAVVEVALGGILAFVSFKLTASET